MVFFLRVVFFFAAFFFVAFFAAAFLRLFLAIRSPPFLEKILHYVSALSKKFLQPKIVHEVSLRLRSPKNGTCARLVQPNHQFIETAAIGCRVPVRHTARLWRTLRHLWPRTAAIAEPFRPILSAPIARHYRQANYKGARIRWREVVQFFSEKKAKTGLKDRRCVGQSLGIATRGGAATRCPLAAFDTA